MLAYEPMPENAQCLEENLRLNGCAQAQCTTAAVGGEAGTAKMTVSRNYGGHVLGTDYREVGGVGEVAVPVITLQDIFDENGLERVEFLKLDCEGSEGAILSTSRHLLPRIDKIAMEFHDTYSSLDHDAIVRLLREAGFTTRLSWDGTSTVGYIFARRTDS